MNEETGGPAKPAKARRDRDGLHKRRGIWHYKLKVAGRWKEVSTHTKNYAAAKKDRTKAITEQEQGRLPTDMANWTFTKASEHWLATRKQLVEPITWRVEGHRLGRLKKVFAEKRLAQITGTEITAYQVQRRATVGPSTVNAEIKVLRHVLKMARLWLRVADDVRLLPQQSGGPGRALSAEEEKKLFETALADKDGSVAYFAGIVSANTTMRGCELKRLKLADVDLVNKTVAVRRSATKTNGGVRLIPLNISAVWAFARLIERAKALGAKDPGHFVFPFFSFRKHVKDSDSFASGFDPTRHQTDWKTGWRHLVKRAGLSGLRFHDLRHHCITRLAEAGVADQTLMAIAGHVSKSMLDHYSHVRLQARRSAVDALVATVQPQAAMTTSNDACEGQALAETVN